MFPFDKTLPKMEVIRRIAGAAKQYPVSAQTMVNIARQQNLDADTIDFLKLFPGPGSADFKSEEDFIIRCAEMAIMIYEERCQPVESAKVGEP